MFDYRMKIVEDKVEDLPPSSSLLVDASSTTKYVSLTSGRSIRILLFDIIRQLVAFILHG